MRTSRGFLSWTGESSRCCWGTGGTQMCSGVMVYFETKTRRATTKGCLGNSAKSQGTRAFGEVTTFHARSRYSCWTLAKAFFFSRRKKFGFRKIFVEPLERVWIYLSNQNVGRVLRWCCWAIRVRVLLFSSSSDSLKLYFRCFKILAGGNFCYSYFFKKVNVTIWSLMSRLRNNSFHSRYNEQKIKRKWRAGKE